jgi:hypothetical protein
MDFGLKHHRETRPLFTLPRSIILNAEDAIPEPALRHCMALALTYHLNKRKPARAR